MVIFKEFPDKQSLIKNLTKDVFEALSLGIAKNQKASLVVSGGSTPKPLFQELQKAELDWSKIYLTLADERWVSTDHADSNEKLVRDNLVSKELNFISLKNQAQTPFLGVAKTNHDLATLPKPFDVVLLGMGDDGHTASFFPGSKDLASALYPESNPESNPESKDTLCAGLTPPPYAAHPRMTLTLPTLLNAKKIIILFTGIDKKNVYLKACEDGPIEILPIRAIIKQQQTSVEVYWTA
ncbi:MAG: 6-phosphogluconolactonase [Bdellovibrio sp. 28-41-41]|nr:MAG: 6-phosphogluconolactonase [Bdellovibrio sp. 28-41-41]